MAVGERPFRGETNISTLSSILRDTPPPITDRNVALPRELDRMVRRCLAKDPRNRYQSAADLRSDLEELKQDTDSGVRVSGGAAATSLIHARPRRKIQVAAVGAVLILIASTAGYLVWSRAGSVPPTTVRGATRATDASSRRIVVTAFENRTGDRSLDSLGTVVAEGLIQGLTEARIGEPVPNVVAVQEARAIRAGVLITGAFDQHGDTLTFQAKVMRGSDGTLVYAPEPASVPKANVDQAVSSLHQHVKTAIAMQLAGWDPGLLSRIPAWEANQEYESGVELFGADTPRAIRHFERALEIDPQYVFPRVYLANAHANAGRWEQAAASMAPLTDERQRLSPYERAWVDCVVAEQRGRRTEALVSILEAEKLDPQNYLLNYVVGLSQLRLNRPAATLATFARVPDPDWLTRFGSGGVRWNVASTARHFLGDFQSEFREAEEARRVTPRSIPYRGAEARALIGLGKTAEALRVVDDLLTMPGSAGPTMIGVVLELRAHGSRQPSLELATRTADWYRNRPPNVAVTEATQAGMARALYAAEKWEEAQQVAQALVGQSPEKLEYTGMLGVIAARRGNLVDAKRWSDALSRLSRPYLFGSHTMWRARIAALLGDHTAAIDLLRDALAEGTAFSIEMHRDMDLEPLKENAAFRELMRPKE